MRVVLDTVIYVRALINRQGPPGRIVHEFYAQFTSLTSPPLIPEVFDVLGRSSLRTKLPNSTDISWQRVLTLLATSELVVPRRRLDVCRDPNDNKFFECAVAGRADYIVSEDSDILDVGEYEGVRTITAQGFIDILESARR
jgi:putative PIN family toxin of toxin-antitoxin system